MTTPKKPAAAKKPAKPLPHGKAPALKVEVRATYSAFGKDNWRLIRPNQLLANATMGEDDTIDVHYLNRYFGSYLHPDDRVPFFEAAMDAVLDIEQLMNMMMQFQELTFEDAAV